MVLVIVFERTFFFHRYIIKLGIDRKNLAHKYNIRTEDTEPNSTVHHTTLATYKTKFQLSGEVTPRPSSSIPTQQPIPLGKLVSITPATYTLILFNLVRLT